MKGLKHIFTGLGFVLLFILLQACSTKKNTVITRSYHHLTSQYNIFFNATEIKREAHKKIESSYEDDFNTFLPVSIYSNRQVTSRMLPDMDKVIKKCSKVITMHSITAKPKRRRGNLSEKQREFYRKSEFNKYIDDSYFLMGQAYFYKNDQFPALQNFQYVITQYPEDGLKNDATLWMARSHVALKDYDQAREIMDRLEAEPNLDERLVAELAVLRAEWHMQQEQYADAYGYLDQAVSMIRDKDRLRRYTYIMAQILEEQEDFTSASLKYQEVIDLNPDYRMAFNARINRARLYEGDQETGAQIRKELQKMLKDEKNLEFLDQIYYALAELDFKEGLVDRAIERYRLSARSSVGNLHQQALSYLALGKIYYNRQEYIPAQEFYDSCMVSLPEVFPNRDSIEILALSLNTLAQNLRLIHREDSLQALAAMPQEEREALILAKMEEAQKAEEERQRLEMEDRMGGRNMRMSGNMMGGMGGRGGGQLQMAPGGMNPGQPGGMSNEIGGATSSWYFYNPTTLSFGQGEFQKIWGRRKLEDNWRRSNKGISSALGDLTTEGEEGEVVTPTVQSQADQFRPTQREYYTADLPINDSLVALSDERIQAALFNAGKVFRDELKKTDEAVDYFSRLIERYPETERLLFTYYNLYQIHDQAGRTVEANRYKDLILSKFPDSRSAQIISNPNYFREIEEERLRVIGYYQDTYEKFLRGMYAEVISQSENADTAFGVNPIRDKFGLLRVMSMGALDPGNEVVMINRLNELVFRYPESEIRETASILLDFYQGEADPFEVSGAEARRDGLLIGKVEQTDAAPEQAEFRYDEDDVHYYVAVLTKTTPDLNRMTFNISNFNIENYDQDFFEVSTNLLNDDLMMIVVKNFNSAQDGMGYFYALQADPVVFSDFEQRDFRHFVISRENFNLFVKNKNVFGYIQFFDKNYLTTEN